MTKWCSEEERNTPTHAPSVGQACWNASCRQKRLGDTTESLNETNMPYLTLASKACFVFSTTHNLFYCYATLQNWCFFYWTCKPSVARVTGLGLVAWVGLFCSLPSFLEMDVWGDASLFFPASLRPSSLLYTCSRCGGSRRGVCVAGVCVCMHVCNVCVTGELPPPTASPQAKLKSGAKLQHIWCGFTWFFYLL